MITSYKALNAFMFWYFDRTIIYFEGDYSYTQGRPYEVRGPIILCKSCSVLLCVLEQPRVDNSNAGSLKRGAQLGAIDPIAIRLCLYTQIRHHTVIHLCQSNLIEYFISKSYQQNTNPSWKREFNGCSSN